MKHTLILTLTAVALLLVAAGCRSTTSPDDPKPPADALPFSRYLLLEGDSGTYIEVPHDPALNPTGAITLEGWVKFDVIGCVSLIGKNWQQAYWVGTCDALRSYLRGGGSLQDGGAFEVGAWTHWAVSWDGSVRRHYLNGELVDEFAEAGPLTESGDPVRIGSDAAWEVTPRAGLAEFRLWNVARTQSEIQSTMNVAFRTATPGLVAVWPLAEDGRDTLGNHDGAVVGSPLFLGIDDPPPAAPPATPTGLAAVAGDSEVTLTWNANSEADFAHYNVYQGTASGSLDKVAEVPAGTETYTATGLTNGTTYSFAIDAENTAGNRSPRTAAVAATPFAPDDDPPATPTGLTATPGDERVVLTWNANAEDDLSHYNVYHGTESGNLTKVADVLAGTESYTASGLTNGTVYYFAISAEDLSGNESPPTGEVSATPTVHYYVRGSALSSHGGTLYLYRSYDDWTGIEASVTVNGEAFAYMGDGRYYKFPFDTPIDVGGVLELEVVGEVTLTATGLVPERPNVTEPADGATFSPVDTITVMWTSATDPDRFQVTVEWGADGGGTAGRGYAAPGTARQRDIPASDLPNDGRAITISVAAFNDGAFSGAYDPASTMGIRTLSAGSENPTVTVGP